MPKWMVCTVVECISFTEPPPPSALPPPIEVRVIHLQPEECRPGAEGECSTSDTGDREAFLLAAGKSADQLFGGGRSALLRSADFSLQADDWMGAAADMGEAAMDLSL